jgi:hypothetical protein
VAEIHQLPGIQAGEQPPIEDLVKVVNLDVVTCLATDPDRVLKGAIGKLSCVVVVGYQADGEEYFAASISDGGDVLWMLERAKMNLLHIVDGHQE